MNKLYLSEGMLSEAFWPRLRQAAATLPEASAVTEAIIAASRVIHSKFPPETAGSISKDAVRTLWLLARYFRPKVIAEVGTFIGRSTLALSEGAGEQLQAMHTCDFSFSEFGIPGDFALSFKNTEKITYHAKTSSTTMFENMMSRFKGSVDCFFLDGRITLEDIELIKELRAPDAVFILDDFEGIEKGVSNAMILRGAFNDLILVRPEAMKSSNSLPHVFNTAVMFNAHSIKLSRQQELPLDMC
jgi:predicted O-methyltransferase YrrM